ncbi:MAG: FliM/FliN family flagellar motor switch protein [Hyphomicrobiaceae bacterium]
MSVPISDELNIRERIEQLFQGSSSGGDRETAVASIEQAEGHLSSAISTFVPIEFELGVPDIRPWSPTDEMVVAEDLITLQLERATTGTKFRCFMSYELVEVFVSTSFGAPVPVADSGFNCRESQFCNFFISNAVLAIIRQLIASINQSRTQTITFEKIVEPDPDGAPDEVMQPGYLATWSLVIKEVRHKLTVYIPASEFVVRDENHATQNDQAEDADADSEWSGRMQSSLAQTQVQLRAVMNRPNMPLEEFSNLKVGDVVEFVDARSASVLLECDGEALFVCDIGQKDGQFAVHVVREV